MSDTRRGSVTDSEDIDPYSLTETDLDRLHRPELIAVASKLKLSFQSSFNKVQLHRIVREALFPGSARAEDLGEPSQAAAA